MSIIINSTISSTQIIISLTTQFISRASAIQILRQTCPLYKFERAWWFSSCQRCEKAYFEQCSEWTAPKPWSKFTTGVTKPIYNNARHRWRITKKTIYILQPLKAQQHPSPPKKYILKLISDKQDAQVGMGHWIVPTVRNGWMDVFSLGWQL